MAVISYTVPPADADGLRRALIGVYSATCESLSRDLVALSAGDVDLAAIEIHRRRAAELDALLDQLGWTPGPATAPLAIRVDVELLEAGYHSMIVDAVELLHERVESTDWPTAAIARMGGDLEHLGRLLDRVGALAGA